VYSSEDDSDMELPEDIVVARPEIKDNEFIKMYAMKNGGHDGDRERAGSIAKNLHFNKKVKKSHPYFNKKAKDEPDIDLEANDLFLMGQITEEEYKKLKG
jgi:hypothetical protein